MPGVSIEVFSMKRIWRFVFNWNSHKFQIWWMYDKQFHPFWKDERYMAERPLLRLQW